MGLGVPTGVWGWRVSLSCLSVHLSGLNAMLILPCDRLAFDRMGDGRAFPRNPRADDMLARLSAELVDMDKDQ